MRRLTTTLFTALTTLVLGALGPASASAHDVLVLSSGSTNLDTQLRTILQNQGHVVTFGDNFTRFSGEGLAGQKVVLLLPNLDSGDGNMPLAGQNALVNFVSAGGGLVTSEWTIWMSAFRSFATLVPILPVLPTAIYSETFSITYREATPDPVLNSGIPSALAFLADFSYGTETYFAPRAGATVFYTSTGGAGGAGVVGWQFGSGRVIQFSTLLGRQELSDAAYSRLVANAVSWSGVDSNPVVSELKFEPATAQVGNSFVAKFAGANVTDDTYLDVRFRVPGSSSDLVVLNWQQGLSGSHGILPGTVVGNWTINGVRAHQERDEHSGEFDAVSATLAVISSTCFMTTPSGDIQGQDLGDSCAFLGIPYAAAPLGNLRWQPPQPSPPWSPSILFATSSPPICAQLNQAGLPQGPEDCLKLNVWVPKRTPTPPAPVIIWIHTGSFVATSANFAAHNGQKLAERNGVIVVALNYRLGPFGFLAHSALINENPDYRSSGNYGLLDQRAAMVWVRDNIASLGGDPGNITIAGQSAGAHSVSLHLVSPRSAGLFHRAVMESGYGSSRWKTLEEAESQGNDFAVALGCANASQVLSCMRTKSPEEVLRALRTAPRWEFVETAAHWGPVVDGLEIPDQPRFLYEQGAFHRVPILLGANRDEGWGFVDRSFPGDLSAAQYQAAVEVEFGRDAPAVLARYRPQDFATPKEALAQLTGDVEYVCETTRLAELVARTLTPVYLYSFEYVIDGLASNPSNRVIHGLDTNFVFGNDFGAPDNRVLNAADRAFASSMGAYWTRFAAHGDPNSASDNSVVHWSAYQYPINFVNGDRYLILDSVIRESKGLRSQPCDFLKPFFFRSVVGSVPASAP
jgi:para-nitrobenzyl esterase